MRLAVLTRPLTRVVPVLLASAGIGAIVIATASADAARTRAADRKSSARTLNFAIVAKSQDNPAFAVAEIAAKQRIRQLGGHINLTWTAPSTADQAAEVQIIDGFIAKHVNGLAVDSLGPAVCKAVNRAIKAGIPTVTWDSDCVGSKRIAYIGSDNFAAGVAAGKLYASAVKRKGPQKIAILTGTPGALDLEQRDQGFEAGLKQERVKFKITTTVPSNEDVSTSVSAVNDTIQGDPTLTGFFFDGPWPLLATPSTLTPMANAVKSGKLTAMSFDTLQPELQYVTNGDVIGLVGQQYAGMGYESLQVLNEIVRCHAKYPTFVKLGLDVVTKKGPVTPAQMNHRWKTSSFPLVPAMPKSGACAAAR